LERQQPVNLVTERTDVEKLRRCGLIVAGMLDRVCAEVKVGVTTLALDQIAGQMIADADALSAPRKVYNFPGNICLSLNDEAVHGIPSQRVIKPGDVVKVDITVESEGWITDACRTVLVEPVDPKASALARCSETALIKALSLARHGRAIWEIGLAIETVVKKSGFKVLRQLCGHGVGKSIHEAPVVPNFYDRRYSDRLKAGMVITIEPILAMSTEEIVTDPDGWTLRTKDGSLSTHFEHSLLITEREPIILTLKP
jgi:methionyl aminopeptidase